MLGVVGGGVFLYLKIFRGVPELADRLMPSPATPPGDPAVPPPPPASMILPDLDEGDEFVRALVEGLSSHPQLAAWLVDKGLVRSFVVAVDNVARGQNPRTHVRFLEPEGRFAVDEVGARAVISDESLRRYDLFTAVVTSLDTTGTVRLYRDLAPLFEDAYAELGNPDTFENALGAAIDRLIAVEVPAGQIEVVERIDSWAFADPALERLGPVEKQLIRLGPDNAREVQAKLLTFKTALALTKARDSS